MAPASDTGKACILIQRSVSAQGGKWRVLPPEAVEFAQRQKRTGEE